MSCIISLILVIALQLHRQLECISNRRVPIVVLNLMSLVYYLNINIKIYLSQQRNSINSSNRKTKQHMENNQEHTQNIKL